MSKCKPDHPTPEDVSRLSEMLRKMDEHHRRAFREATEFKPGDLTPEEEELVRREGLTALNYISQKQIQAQSEAFRVHEENRRRRAVIMARPETDPERVQMLREQRARDFRQNWDSRFSGFGYGMFLLLIFGITVAIIKSYGWPIGSFSALLMLAVLELSYRLYARH